jgi:hypothetical protein
MAELLQSFEAGATAGDGVGITATNSDDAGEAAVATVTATGVGASIAYTDDPAEVMHGAWAAKFTQPTAANSCLFDLIDGGGGSTLFTVQLRLLLTGLPSATVVFPIQPRSTTDGQLGSVRTTNTGLLQLMQQTGTQAAIGTVPLVPGTRYVIDYYGIGGSTTAGELHARVYDWTTGALVESVDAAAVNMGTGLPGRFRYGKGGAATLDPWVIDGIRQTIGSNTPYGYTPATAGTGYWGIPA